jgi:hypothetical protein
MRDEPVDISTLTPHPSSFLVDKSESDCVGGHVQFVSEHISGRIASIEFDWAQPQFTHIGNLESIQVEVVSELGDVSIILSLESSGVKESATDAAGDGEGIGFTAGGEIELQHQGNTQVVGR